MIKVNAVTNKDNFKAYAHYLPKTSYTLNQSFTGQQVYESSVAHKIKIICLPNSGGEAQQCYTFI